MRRSWCAFCRQLHAHLVAGSTRIASKAPRHRNEVMLFVLPNDAGRGPSRQASRDRHDHQHFLEEPARGRASGEVARRGFPGTRNRRQVGSAIEHWQPHGGWHTGAAMIRVMATPASPVSVALLLTPALSRRPLAVDAAQFGIRKHVAQQPRRSHERSGTARPHSPYGQRMRSGKSDIALDPEPEGQADLADF